MPSDVLLRCCRVVPASHIEYLVTTRSSLPGWAQPEVSVRRRFNDFVGLAELLKVRSAQQQSSSSSSSGSNSSSRIWLCMQQHVQYAAYKPCHMGGRCVSASKRMLATSYAASWYGMLPMVTLCEHYANGSGSSG
jgi:hypothetical protein